MLSKVIISLLVSDMFSQKEFWAFSKVEWKIISILVSPPLNRMVLKNIFIVLNVDMNSTFI